MSKTVIVLTLEEHKDGIWITRLLIALPPQVVSIVVTLESLLHQFDPTAPLFPPSSSVIINRVSDAAPPHLQKACVAVLQVALFLQNIQVWNGPTSYGLCSNKWCHHVLFVKAGLSCPSTRLVLLEPTTATKDAVKEAIQNLGMVSDTPLLLKPNAGGFGAGVRRIGANLEQDLQHTSSYYSDQMALIQEYIESDLHYRVWFLRGKVQCGIVHISNGNFASACVATTCSRQSIRAMVIPDDVRNELEEGLLPLLPDAHAGSVEFLNDKAGRRLYFDLNLLSTLPLVERVQDAESVWGQDYDPWKEMANAILDMIN